MRELNFELVPKTSWYSNLRTMLPKRQWDKIKEAVRERSGNTCEICGAKKKPGELDTHETWGYDDETHTQSLVTIRCLCKQCHTSIHIGNANLRGVGDKAINWYCKVNNISVIHALKEVNDAFAEWSERSKYNWNIQIDPKIISELINEDPIINYHSS